MIDYEVTGVTTEYSLDDHAVATMRKLIAGDELPVPYDVNNPFPRPPALQSVAGLLCTCHDPHGPLVRKVGAGEAMELTVTLGT